jgi:hypothetical protein
LDIPTTLSGRSTASLAQILFKARHKEKLSQTDSTVYHR